MKSIIRFCVFLLPWSALSQGECNSTFIKILGSSNTNEIGYSLAVSDQDKAIYAAGIIGDSAVIVKILFSGEIEWVRAFDIVPSRQDHIIRILVDSDGMIAAAGTAGSTDTGGSIFIFRYDPNSNNILWSTEIDNPGVNYSSGLIQKGSGGNYVLIDNPLSPDNHLELIEIDKNNGLPNNQISKEYDLGGPVSLSDAFYAQGKIYGTGRFAYDASQASFRNTLIRFDGTNGNIDWVRLGHKGNPDIARLYGASLVLDQNFIYSVYCGDDDGTSLDETNIFIQKTKENSELVWVKKYDIPGLNDWADEIIKSGNGYVVLARNRKPPSDLVLFKINGDGDVIWARKFDLSNNDNSIPIGSTQAQLIEADQHLYFTALTQNTPVTDMLIVKTDFEGNVNDTCISTTPVNITTTDILQTSWFEWDPDVTDYPPNSIILQPVGIRTTGISENTVCQTIEPLMSIVNMTICNGDIYEGYSISGQYSDHFISSRGCDSVRILILNVTNVILEDKNQTICFNESFEGYSQTGVYIDTFISNFGCDSIRTLHLEVRNQITSKFQTTLCDDHFSAHTTTGTYIDTLQSIDGCDSIRELLIEKVSQYVPNVFSPNNDGINDLFLITQFPEKTYTLDYFGIFDRFGNMVYESKSWPIEWNGKGRNGEPCNPAVFAYVLQYFCGANKVTETGDITLLK